MAEIKKILFITTQLPYPPVSGGVIKSWKLVEYLSEHYELSLAYFLKNNDIGCQEEFAALVPLKLHYTLPLDIPRTAINLLNSNLKRIPLNLYRNKSKKFENYISSICDNYDCLFIDHYEMFQYVPSHYAKKVILHQHNCEYLIWQRFGEIEKKLLKKLALYNQSFWIKRYERDICDRANVILAAPNDIEELIAIGADRDKFFPTYHLGDEELLYLPALSFEQGNHTLLYIGTLSWEANIDGLMWFITEVWPQLITFMPDIKLLIVGKNPDTRLLDIAAPYSNIEFAGFVSELDTVYTKAKVFISPLRFGSGIKVKVINSLYRGLPCVTTAIGAEGLMAEDGKHILLANTASDYASQILRILADKSLWEYISHNSRQLASTHYTWNRVMQEVHSAINSLE